VGERYRESETRKHDSDTEIGKSAAKGGSRRLRQAGDTDRTKGGGPADPDSQHSPSSSDNVRERQRQKGKQGQSPPKTEEQKNT